MKSKKNPKKMTKREKILKSIKVKHKIKKVFPHGEVYVPDLDYWKDKYIRKPVVINFRTTDGKIVKFKATKICRKKK